MLTRQLAVGDVGIAADGAEEIPIANGLPHCKRGLIVDRNRSINFIVLSQVEHSDLDL